MSVINLGSGGGGGSSFSIQYFSTAPSGSTPVAREGTMGLVTTNLPVRRVTIAANQPSSPEENDIWIEIGLTGNIPISVGNRQTITILPKKYWQYVGGDWTNIDHRVYHDGEWAEGNLILPLGIDTFSKVWGFDGWVDPTGGEGITPSDPDINSDGGIILTAYDTSSSKTGEATYHYIDGYIDVSRYSKLIISCKKYGNHNYQIVGYNSNETPQYGTTVKAQVNSTDYDEYEFDISNVNNLYIIFYVDSFRSERRGIIVKEIVLEA